MTPCGGVWGGRIINSLDLGFRWRWIDSFKAPSLFSNGKNTGPSMNTSLCGPQCREKGNRIPDGPPRSLVTIRTTLASACCFAKNDINSPKKRVYFRHIYVSLSNYSNKCITHRIRGKNPRHQRKVFLLDTIFKWGITFLNIYFLLINLLFYFYIQIKAIYQQSNTMLIVYNILTMSTNITYLLR